MSIYLLLLFLMFYTLKFFRSLRFMSKYGRIEVLGKFEPATLRNAAYATEAREVLVTFIHTTIGIGFPVG